MLGELYQADRWPQDVLRGVAKNKPLIVAPRSARVRLADGQVRAEPGLRTIDRQDPPAAPDTAQPSCAPGG